MEALPKWAKAAVMGAVLIVGCLVFFFVFSSVFSSIGTMKNFGEQQVRAAVSRATADHKTIADALDRYKLEHGQYAQNLTALTTPTSYMTNRDNRFPDDPFAPEPGPYGYTVAGNRYIVHSPGPNGAHELDLPADLHADQSILTTKRYDATNGIVSPGDIFKRFANR